MNKRAIVTENDKKNTHIFLTRFSGKQGLIQWNYSIQTTLGTEVSGPQPRPQGAFPVPPPKPGKSALGARLSGP